MHSDDLTHIKVCNNHFALFLVTDLCKFWNGGCSENAKCSQNGEKVNCTCLKDYTGDGYVCSPVNLCVEEDNGGCHEHAICTLTGPVKKLFLFYLNSLLYKRTVVVNVSLTLHDLKNEYISLFIILLLNNWHYYRFANYEVIPKSFSQASKCKH